MNVIVVVCDSLRYDYLGCNGNSWIRTPAIDAFSRDARVFEESIVGSFATIPIRQDFFTGRWAQPFQPWAPLPWDVITLPGYLGDHGYVTMLIHDTPHLVNCGFGFDRPFQGWEFVRGGEVDRWRTTRLTRRDYPCDPRKMRSPEMFGAQAIRNGLARQREEDYTSPRLLSTAINWLEENRDHDKFFLWIDCFDPHEPFDPPQHYVDLYDPGYQGDSVTFPIYGKSDYLSPAELQHMRALYAGEVTMVDRWLGRLLEKISDLGLESSTAVIVASDHGFIHGEHGLVGKGDFYREVSRQVLMVRHPEGRGAGRRSRSLVQPVDLFPSVVELVGLEPPSGLIGRSWVPSLDGKLGERGVAFSGSATTLSGSQRSRAHLQAFDGQWTLLDHPDASSRELYDLASDPQQEHNVAANNPATVDRLHRALVDFYRENGATPDVLQLLEDGARALPPTEPPGDTHRAASGQYSPRTFVRVDLNAL